ncbi:MAG: hypothetical protein AB8B56_00470 [Crocinitomicaceae bacterium]
MGRLSGIVNAEGQMASNTSNNKFGWSSKIIGPGTVRITFGRPFKEVPTVLAQVMNYDAEGEQQSLNYGIIATKEYTDIEVWSTSKGSIHLTLGFAAFGDISES